MPNGRPPIVWHLDTTQIADKFASPPDRLTLVKWVMQLYEANVLTRDETFKAFEKICTNELTDENVRVLLEKIQINAESSRIDEILKYLGIEKQS